MATEVIENPADDVLTAERQIEVSDADFEAIRAHTRHAIILIIPGLGSSGAEHWQTLWETKLPNAVRVEQDDWVHANKNEWVRKLNEYIERCGDEEIILIAHSLACPTVVHWVNEHAAITRAKILGALLVAPADVDIPVEGINDFSPLPLEKALPFKSIVAASEDDPIVAIERAEQFAQSWGAQIKKVGKRGHINAASNLGYWKQGIEFLQELLSDA